MRWTLAEGPKSEARFATLLREQLGASESAAELVVSNFAAAVCDDGISADEDSWASALRETLLECGLVDEEEAVLKDVVALLRRQHIIVETAAVVPPLAVGTQVVARLAEDGQWHDAVVAALLAPPDDAPAGESLRRYRVIFSEFGKPQELDETELVNVEDVVSDDDGGDSLRDGECELCARSMPLTFHHLIPRETHGRFLAKGLPPGVKGEPTRVWLATYGLAVCRPCHTHIHRVASNDELADHFNTAQRLLAHPEIAKFVAFMGKQRVRLKRA